jgi:hypothetical protein
MLHDWWSGCRLHECMCEGQLLMWWLHEPMLLQGMLLLLLLVLQCLWLWHQLR